MGAFRFVALLPSKELEPWGGVGLAEGRIVGKEALVVDGAVDGKVDRDWGFGARVFSSLELTDVESVGVGFGKTKSCWEKAEPWIWWLGGCSALAKCTKLDLAVCSLGGILVGLF